jgi:carboxylate-amine ligase
MENKWRAAALGNQGPAHRLRQDEEVPHASLLEELLEFVDEVVDHLGSREHCERARAIVAQGTGAERQLEVFRRTGDLKAVMDYVVQETEVGLDVPAVRT